MKRASTLKFLQQGGNGGDSDTGWTKRKIAFPLASTLKRALPRPAYDVMRLASKSPRESTRLLSERKYSLKHQENTTLKTSPGNGQKNFLLHGRKAMRNWPYDASNWISFPISGNAPSTKSQHQSYWQHFNGSKNVEFWKLPDECGASAPWSFVMPLRQG